MATIHIATIKATAEGKLHDSRGLFMIKRGETGKWVFRYSFRGKRRDMGLGSWPTVSISEARKTRDKWAAVLASGKDPIDARAAEIEAERIADQEAAAGVDESKDPTFEKLVDLVFEAKKATLRGDGTRGRWKSPLELYMIPAIGKKPGSQITRQDLVTALRPIWRTKPPTAEKAIQRTRIVLRSAKLMGFPTDPDIVHSAQEILGVVTHKVQHMPSVPWQDIPDLYAALPDTVGGNCNRWLILTLVRIHAGRAARVSEIDFETNTWTVPADRIKGRRGKVDDFRVPLSDPALEIAQPARDIGLDLIFPGNRLKSPITDAAVEKALRILDAPGTPHGFRTSFRTWVQDTQACSWEVAEMVLGHRTGGMVERSYARSDLLDQRRSVMNTWADFVLGGK